MIFLTAFLTGLFGSFHCAGMCGPIAFALPGSKEKGVSFYFGRFLYNLGRMLSYALLGFILGSFGLGLKLAGIQQGLSISVGVIIIATLIYQKWLQRGGGFSIFSLLSSQFIQKLFRSKSLFSLGLIGMLNGLLPCGFVYIAILGASVTQNSWDGAIFMALFGLGTFPMMFGVSIIGQFLSQKTRSTLVKWSPVFAFIIAILFIIRGLNLGIPYMSPKLVQPKDATEQCD
ncbi:MAG: sulfite exporter TauE/SafE family protein [Sphingobacteriales bacterium]|jgi:sulfite exporter TauE/SafE|nr:sulfite exporter TauE/SafE family protein [Sphingobacteriales bacterium]